MTKDRLPITPKFIPPLDPEFHPAALFNRAFRTELDRTGQSQVLVLGLERSDGTCSRYETKIFTENHPWACYNNFYVERIVKFLLWQRGGYKVYIGGSPKVGEHIQKLYSAEGNRRFDYRFMASKCTSGLLRWCCASKPKYLLHKKPANSWVAIWMGVVSALI